MNENCPLCGGVGFEFYNRKINVYLQCGQCGGIFRPHKYLPDSQAEKERYLQHKNDVNDPAYQQFVEPLVEAVIKEFAPSHKGLDFGAGTGPVITKLLRDKNFDIAVYDPFFHNQPELLLKPYDFIVCCEVVEHFHHPYQEFSHLYKMLNENGKLFCKTYIYNPEIDFPSWNYKNDPTHVFIYQQKTLEWIREKFGFISLTTDGNLIVFGK